MGEGLKRAGKLRETQRQVKIANDTKSRGLAIIGKLFANDELDDVIGSIEGVDESVLPFGGQKIRSDQEAEAIADIKELEGILTGDSLKLMSGTLTDKDIEMLKDIAAGGLNRKRGEKRFRDNLAEIKSRLSSSLGANKSLPKGTTENDDGTFTLPDGRIVRRKK